MRASQEGSATVAAGGGTAAEGARQEAALPGLADYALLLLLSAIWGSSFMFTDIAVETMPALPLVAFRLILAAVLLGGIALLLRRRLNWTWRLLTFLVAAAFFGNALPFFLISWGQEEIDSNLAAILMAAMPLTAVLLAHIFTDDDKLNVLKAIGVGFGVVGLIILMGPQRLLQLGDDTVRQIGVASAAVCYGVNTLITRSLMRHDKLAIAATVMTLAALMMTVATVLMSDVVSLEISSRSLWSAVLLGILHTALATLLMFLIISRQGASFFSQLNFLVPLFGVGYGAWVMGETIQSSAGVALIVILTGVALARWGMRKTKV